MSSSVSATPTISPYSGRLARRVSLHHRRPSSAEPQNCSPLLRATSTIRERSHDAPQGTAGIDRFERIKRDEYEPVCRLDAGSGHASVSDITPNHPKRPTATFAIGQRQAIAPDQIFRKAKMRIAMTGEDNGAIPTRGGTTVDTSRSGERTNQSEERRAEHRATARGGRRGPLGET